MAPSAVCFGAKDDSYGPFKILVPGSVITFKLTYLNGSVSCKPGAESRWGCRVPPVIAHPMGTHITDSSKTRLLPKTEYLKRGRGCGRSYYHLPWATPNSPELIFDNFSSLLPVTANQVWFGEDLNNCCERNNGLYVWQYNCLSVLALNCSSLLDASLTLPVTTNSG